MVNLLETTKMYDVNSITCLLYDIQCYIDFIAVLIIIEHKISMKLRIRVTFFHKK